LLNKETGASWKDFIIAPISLKMAEAIKEIAGHVLSKRVRLEKLEKDE
jgi:hypothetical protein